MLLLAGHFALLNRAHQDVLQVHLVAGLFPGPALLVLNLPSTFLISANNPHDRNTLLAVGSKPYNTAEAGARAVRLLFRPFAQGDT